VSVFSVPRLNYNAGRAIEHAKTRELDLNSIRLQNAPTGHQFDLPYMVEQWDDTDSHVDELIALTGDYRVARAAYEEAVKGRPGRIVTLRQKMRLLADSRRPD
jgi:hypothetical protein